MCKHVVSHPICGVRARRLQLIELLGVFMIRWSLICAFGLTLFTACHPYGDSMSDLGIKPSNAAESGLVGNWQSDSGSGEVLTIRSDSGMSDTVCSVQGSVLYVTQNLNCGAGTSACGSTTLSIASASSTTGCAQSGEMICAFWITSGTGAGTSNLALICNGGAKVNYHRM